jgi:predicted nucleotidyltransferase
MAGDGIIMTLALPPIDEIVRRIVEAIHPRRIVLFGSYACGGAQWDSDVDIMVEWDTDARPAERRRAIYALFLHRTWAMDVVVYTPAEVRRLSGLTGTLLRVIEREGRTLYEEPAQ